MRCDQIRLYLADYVTGELPGYKRSWVAQHLAGCEECSLVAAEGRRPGAAPVAAAAEPLFDPRGPASVAVQRPVPPGVRRAVILSLLALTLGAAWFLLRGTGSTGKPMPAIQAAGSDMPLPVQATMQSQGGVSLGLELLVERQDEMCATFRFAGPEISPPGSWDAWVAVHGASGQRLPAWLPLVVTDAGGITVQVAFQLPAGETRFDVTFTGLNQNLSSPWSLQLPFPPDRLELPALQLRGIPEATLRAYGMVDGLLRVDIVAPDAQAGAAPRLFLRDAEGVRFAPSAYAGPNSKGEISLQFPVPKSLRLPMRLVGNGAMHNYLGPWTIEANMLK